MRLAAPVALACVLSACGTLLGIGESEQPDPAPAPVDAGSFVEASTAADVVTGSSDATTDVRTRDATVDGPPDPCKGLPCERIVFTTSNRWSGNLGGVAGADAKCQQAADAAGGVYAGRTWKAWISAATTDDSAAKRLVHGTGLYSNGPWAIATGWDQLASAVHDHAIRLDENGNLPQADDIVWTGTNPDGTALVGATGASCNDWTSENGGGGTGIAAYGNASASDATWTHEAFQTCDGLGHLYCIEQ